MAIHAHLDSFFFFLNPCIFFFTDEEKTWAWCKFLVLVFGLSILLLVFSFISAVDMTDGKGKEPFTASTIGQSQHRLSQNGMQGI